MKQFKKERESNFELLRIIAMAMVLAVHIFYSLPIYNSLPADTPLLTSLANLVTHETNIVCVNIFVLISGWFGIKFSYKGLANFIFQVLFFSIGLTLPFFINGDLDISQINILSSFALYNNSDWFVWAYLLLYALAPVLNSFIKNTDKKTFRRTILLYFTLQTIIAVFTRVDFFKGGYHFAPFIGLYLLAGYMKQYPLNIKNKYIYFAIYVACVIINCGFIFSRININLSSFVNTYLNPLNIIGPMALVIFFSKLNIKSKAVNWVASSCFAVFLTHMHFCIFPYYRQGCEYFIEKYSGPEFIAAMTLYSAVIYIISVLLDKPRIVLFNAIWKKIGTKQ